MGREEKGGRPGLNWRTSLQDRRLCPFFEPSVLEGQPRLGAEDIVSFIPSHFWWLKCLSCCSSGHSFALECAKNLEGSLRIALDAIGEAYSDRITRVGRTREQSCKSNKLGTQS